MALVNILLVQMYKSTAAEPNALFLENIVKLHFQLIYNKASEYGSLVQIFLGMLVFLVCHNLLMYGNRLKKVAINSPTYLHQVYRD